MKTGTMSTRSGGSMARGMCWGRRLDADAAALHAHSLDGRGTRTEKKVDDDVFLVGVTCIDLCGDLGDVIAVIVELVSARPVPAVDRPQRVGFDVVVFN